MAKHPQEEWNLRRRRHEGALSEDKICGGESRAWATGDQRSRRARKREKSP